jgi:Fic family protein
MPSPPFSLTPEILSLCTDIARLIGRLEGLQTGPIRIELRKASRIRSVQSTTAIEGNTLSEEQVTAILEGTRVAGPKKDIQEIKNALAAYDRVREWQPSRQADFLKAHELLMRGLAEDNGSYRQRNVGVLDGSKVAHVAPPAARVPGLMEELFAFLRDHTIPALVGACLFHYELEFIHPFSDGNGRMGRLWQQVILAEEYPLLVHLPVESLIRQHQDEYYAVLRECDLAGDSTAFVGFMLGMIRQALREHLDSFHPERPTPDQRIETARERFQEAEFTRKDYLALHKGISTATASRDLRDGTDRGILHREGEKGLTRYRFK